MMWNLLAVSSEPTNADAWTRTLALLAGSGGILTILFSAAAYVWKKHADARFEAERQDRASSLKMQEDATKAQRELIDYLKKQVDDSRATIEQNTQSLHTQTMSLQTQTDVLQKMSDKQQEHLAITQKTHDALVEAAKDPNRVCRAPKRTRKVAPV